MSERPPEQQIREALQRVPEGGGLWRRRNALAALDRLVAERDEATQGGILWADRCRAAEEREAALREALEEIASDAAASWIGDLARAALAAAASRTP